ncbi:unnamed protein product [Chondrus crispus]|uniref:DUF1989 domain-containing protein n=1 Tax=Chondrus crispus TaxID=2769 RepID=R7Q430_CHOCR|nr:unnamed protein product [Chondrus crispus]CDF32623.1 unnamed protein product [Chondrus crispus]|eukprot:XP_005712394.1 unnamed protein product [Chondrus crispus]
MGAKHVGRNGRTFKLHAPVPCYDVPASTLAAVPDSLLTSFNLLPLSARETLRKITIPARDGRAWHVPAGAFCRLEVSHGPQVADVNIWNTHNPRERLYTSKTRLIHSSHLSVGDSLWSGMPYLRPLATIVSDSVQYGIDEDNAGVHDVIGSRCDPYTNAAMTGANANHCCHSNLVRAVLPFGLTEHDVHDVFNVFMCTGFMRSTGQYFAKPSPVVKGDYLEFFAHMDLLVATSTCPQGDVSIPCGSDRAPTCYPLGATVFRLPGLDLKHYTPPKVSSYQGVHGLASAVEQPDADSS